MRWLVFARREYAEPLALETEVQAEEPPTLEALELGDGWLEVMAIPADAAVWILRDADLVLEP